MLPIAASENSRRSQDQMLEGNGSGGGFVLATTISIIVLATQSVAIGTSATSTRDASSPTTTPGPESHSSLNTGGMLRNAAARSRQFFRSAGFILLAPYTGNPPRTSKQGRSPDSSVIGLTSSVATMRIAN